MEKFNFLDFINSPVSVMFFTLFSQQILLWINKFFESKSTKKENQTDIREAVFGSTYGLVIKVGEKLQSYTDLVPETILEFNNMLLAHSSYEEYKLKGIYDRINTYNSELKDLIRQINYENSNFLVDSPSQRILLELIEEISKMREIIKEIQSKSYDYKSKLHGYQGRMIIIEENYSFDKGKLQAEYYQLKESLYNLVDIRDVVISNALYHFNTIKLT